MTDDLVGNELRESPSPPGRGESFVWLAMGLCLVLSVVAFVLGVNMAAHRRVAECANGAFFPEGTTDFNCYVHPQLATGVAIALFAVMLGTITVFCAISAAGVVRGSSRT